MLKDVWKLSWKGMMFTYAVLLVESVAFAFFPLYLGRAVDGLFEKDWFWFGVYLSICVVGCAVGTFRRCVDTRIFGRAWVVISSGVAARMMQSSLGTAKVITRSGLSVRFVDFFEFALPNTITAVVGVIVPLWFLWTVVPSSIPMLMLLVVAMAVIALWVSHKEKRWDAVMQEARDDRFQAIEDSDPDGVRESYELSLRAYTKRSDWSAGSWLAQCLLGIGGEVVVILALSDDGATPGEVLAAMGFVWNLFENVTRTTDLFGWIRSIEVAEELISEGLE
jgi:hypothetical protein